MTASLMPPLALQFINSAGIPVAFGNVYTAQAGTTAGPGQAYPQATYTDSTATTTNPNPVPLDATGSAVIWVSGYYSIAVYASSGALVRTANNVSNSGGTVTPSAIQENLYGSAVASGSSDAIQAAFNPVVTTTTLATGNTPLRVRAIAANATTTPTFTPNYGVVTAATIVKGFNTPLAIGDIVLGAWMDLQWDSALSKWVLLNPATIASGGSVTSTAIQENLYSSATASGGADTLQAAFSPVVTATSLATGNTVLSVRAAATNATTTPTFTPNYGVLTAATIVKGNGLPLAVGDIAGAGHWLDLQWDSISSKWVLLNPATGVTAGSTVTPLAIQENSYIAGADVGTVNAMQATFSPAITSTTLTGNTLLRVRAAYANTSTTPTFTPNSGTITAATIVKGSNQALAVGDIPGPGAWAELQWDISLGKWVLLNPAASTGGGSSPFALKVAILGDSISQAQAFSESWVDQFSRLVNQMGMFIECKNWAISGATFYLAYTDTTAHQSGTRTQVQQAIAQGADLVFVMLGINDSIYIPSRTEAQIVADGTNVYNALKAGLPSARIVLINEAPHDVDTLGLNPSSLINSQAIPFTHSPITYRGMNNSRVNNTTYLNTSITGTNLGHHQNWGAVATSLNAVYDANITLKYWKIARLGCCIDTFHTNSFGHMWIAFTVLKWFATNNNYDNNILNYSDWTSGNAEYVNLDSFYTAATTNPTSVNDVFAYRGYEITEMMNNWFYGSRYFRGYIGPDNLPDGSFLITGTFSGLDAGATCYFYWTTNNFLNTSKTVDATGRYSHTFSPSSIGETTSAGTYAMGFAFLSSSTGQYDVYERTITFLGTASSGTYPPAGVANSTGSAWGTSYTVGTSPYNLVQLNSSGYLPALNGSLLTGLPGGTYPGAGVANSTGTGWGTSYTVGTSPYNLVQLNSSGNIPYFLLSGTPTIPTMLSQLSTDSTHQVVTNAQIATWNSYSGGGANPPGSINFIRRGVSGDAVTISVADTWTFVNWTTRLTGAGSADTSSGFTAPINGIYSFSCNLHVGYVPAATNYLAFAFYTAAAPLQGIVWQHQSASALSLAEIVGTQQIYLTAGQTVQIAVYQDGTTGASFDILNSQFSGFLVYQQ